MSTEVDSLLRELNSGDTGRFGELVSLVHAELRRMAGSLMRHQKQGITLQPTALVNEAYLRLVQGKTDFQSRAHFFGAAARAMRQVLVAYARHRGSVKRAGQAQRVTFNAIEGLAVDGPDLEVLAVHEALEELGTRDPCLCRLLELRYFAGFSLEEIGRLQGVSLATVKRDWTFARAWLFEYLSREVR